MTRERRRFPRVPEPFSVRCRIVGDPGESWRLVTTLDLSAGGAGFECEEPYELSDALELRIDLPSFRAPLVLRGRVVRSRPLAGGTVECAVEFLDVSPEQQGAIDEMVKFLSKRIE